MCGQERDHLLSTLCCSGEKSCVRRGWESSESALAAARWAVLLGDKYGIDDGSEKWLPQLEVILVLAGLADVLDRLDSAIIRICNCRALLERWSHFSSE